MKRVDSVDVLRALALIGMVLCHYPIYLSSSEGPEPMVYFLANHALGGDFAASWFVFLVGVSQVLSARKRAGELASDTGRVLLRGAAIFVMGLLFLLLVQGYEELWVWDILTFIGAATVVLLFCRLLSSRALLLICTAVTFITPWLRSWVDLAALYGGGFFSVRWISDFLPNFLFDPVQDYQGAPTFLGNVLGFFLTGQFPILPWIIFPIVGFVIGRRLAENRLADDSPFLMLIGGVLTFTGLFTAWAGSQHPPFDVAGGYLAPLSFYPQSFSMGLFLLGVVLLLFTALWNRFDRRPAPDASPGLFMRYCRLFSRYSLTIYITHFALFFIPLRFIRFMGGPDYFHDLTSPTVALGLAVGLLILYYPVLTLWDRFDGTFSFEWILARVLAPFSRPALAPGQGSAVRLPAK